MRSIYETKSYKLILSYQAYTKIFKDNVFSKLITFNVVEFNNTKCDYFITILMYYNKTNNTIRKQYNAYNPEIDDWYLEAIKQYFKDLHNLLFELDKL